MSTQKPQPLTKARWTWRAAVVVVIAAVVGLGVGGALTRLLPEGGLFARDRAGFHLRLDSADGLRDAATIANGDTALNDVAALARLLLWLEHGAPDSERASAEKLLLKASSSARTSPEALYARALLAALPASFTPLPDPRLDEEIKAAPATPLVLLASAVRTRDAAERRNLVERAALGRDPTPHATHQLARTALAAGDVSAARAALDRLFRLDPKHAAGAATAVIVGLIEANQATAVKGGPPAPASQDEARALDLLDGGISDLDEDQLAIILLAAGLARNGTPDKELLQRAQLAATHSSQNARHLLEIFVCEGDADAAGSIVSGLKSTDSLGLLLAVSRARFLGAVPQNERRAAQKQRGISAQGLRLGLGALTFSFSHPTAGADIVDVDVDVELGLPLIAVPDPDFFPEKRVRQLLLSIQREGGLEKLDKLDSRLSAVERLGLAERAAARGELGAALTLLQEARDLVGPFADVSLLDASLRAQQRDVAGVKAALDAAIAAAPDDPDVLLMAARRSIENDSLGGAVRSLAAFKKLRFKSASASAVEAMIEARTGNPFQARAALAEAKKLCGSDDDLLTLRASVFVNRLGDVAEARRAADRLMVLNDTGGGDIVGAWVAEAAYRSGNQPRAEAALKAILDVKPWMGEAHFFYAQAIAFDPTRAKEARASALNAIRKIERGPLIEEAKRLALVLKKR